MCVQEAGSPQSERTSVGALLVSESKFSIVKLAVSEFEYCYAVSLGVAGLGYGVLFRLPQ